MSNIKSSKLWWLNEESLAMLERGYLLPNQTVEEKLEIICQRASDILGRPDLKERFKEVFERGWASLSSPIWANFGEDRGLPISCFSSYIDDSIDHIFSTAYDVAIMTKMGGGTGADFSAIRPIGSKVSRGGEASGVLSFIEVYDSIIKNVSQSGVRKGGLAAYLDINHPEIMDFLRIKNRDSEIQSINTAVKVDDKFMEEMIAGDSDKRKVWAEVLKSRREKGIPYLFFTDTANRNKPEVYKDMEIRHSNLCVSKDTQILTDEGQIPISDLEGQYVNVWNGEEFSEVQVFKTGENKELVRVITTDGYELDCTPYHKFYVQRGYYKGSGKNKLQILEKRASELEKGDKLIKFELPVIEGEKELSKAYTNGFFSGEGTYRKGVASLYVYEPKKECLPFLEVDDCNINWDGNQKRYTIINIKGLKEKFFVPDATYTIESRLEWLAGILDADGTVTDFNGSQTLQLESVEKEFLREIQLMLQTLGCDSKVTLNRDAGKYKLPANDGTRGLKEYDCREVNRLLINGNSLFKLIQMGIKFNRLKPSGRKPARECSAFIKIDRVESLDGLHDTYCFTEPKRNKGMFNGMLTGNCNEIFLPTNKDESLVCCLLSMNLYLYDEWKDTDAIELMVYFLDSVMSDFIEKSRGMKGMERALRFAERHRALGLGALGFHSLLQRKSLSFDSLEASYLNNEVFKLLKEKSYKASEQLAKEYGEPEVLKGHGRRNTTLLAIAPTTSSASILGQVSPSVEPYKSNYYTVVLAKGSFERINKPLSKLLKSKGRDNEDVWRSIILNQGSVQHLDFLDDHEKNVFKTFSEISPDVIIRLASQRQKYICQGQSINLAISNDVPPKELNRIHIEAWKKGLKGLYYQRGTSVTKEQMAKLMECTSCSA